jgi:photosystem II stability/assembly factor-like uncharacterized protein
MFVVRIVLILLCVGGVYNKFAYGQSWELVTHPALQGPIQAIGFEPWGSSRILVGTEGSLYVSPLHGGEWRRVTHFGSGARINEIYAHQNQFFVLTTNGLFVSDSELSSWKHVFRGFNNEERDTRTIVADPHHEKIFYLGTRGGLFQSDDGGITWHKIWNELRNDSISKLVSDSETGEIFAAAGSGLYRFIPKWNRTERVFAASGHTLLEVAGSDDSEYELDSASPGVISVVTIQVPFHKVIMTTENQVFVSEDEGNYWDTLPSTGLTNTGLKDIAYTTRSNALILATKREAFAFHPAQQKWERLPGLPGNAEIFKLMSVPTTPETLVAATSQGLYFLTIRFGPETFEPVEIVPLNQLKLLKQLIGLEPDVRTLQKEAIRYANVSNSKISRWQWMSHLRALVPTLSFGKDFSRSNNIDLDRGSTNTPDKYILGPENTSEGWDVGVDWDFSELIWNSAQTSIDSREKLMVELREDVLSQLTRLYFERRRAQVEFVLRPPPDPYEQLEHLLRIDEHTANIDAFTNGFLSTHLAKLYANHPNLNSLWQNARDGSR